MFKRSQWLLCLMSIQIVNLLASYGVIGATATAPMNVTSTVVNACIVVATNTNFGSISGNFTSPVDASNGNITVTCTLGVSYTIAIGSTVNANSTFRRMISSSSNYIGYNIYSNAGFSVLWGNGTQFGNTLAGVATGLPQLYTIYARIPTGQTPVPAGSYNDNAVPVTVTY